MDEEEYSSDTSDEDYVPVEGEAVSEEDDSGLDETQGDDQTGGSKPGGPKKKAKRKVKKKGAVDFGTRKRQGGIKLDDDDEITAKDAAQANGEDNFNKQLAEQIEKEKIVVKEEQEKKKADSLWADFMKDVGGSKPKPKPSSSGLGALSSVTKTVGKSPKQIKPHKSESNSGSTKEGNDEKKSKVTITKEYDFAGEVVKITKEVDVNSREAKAELKKQEEKTTETKPTAGPSLSVLKRPGGGLGSVLGQINKKQKMSTLEKSKLDWNSFKQDEGIDDELQIHNRGKEGYLERMAFLERTDHRQFEIEKNLRLSNSKR